jgi:hypothetical protein
MNKNRITVASLLMTMLILGLVFVPVASAKSTINDQNEISGLFGVEMSEYLRQNIIQPDPYTFVAAPDIEDEDVFFAAWDDYEKKVFEQKRIDDKNVSTRGTITLDAYGTDYNTMNVGSSYVEGKTYFHGIRETGATTVTFTGDGYNRGKWYGSGNADRIALDTSVVVSGVYVSISVPFGAGFTVSGNTASFGDAYTNTKQGYHAYNNLEASGSWLYDFDQNDGQSFRFGSSTYRTHTHVDL